MSLSMGWAIAGLLGQEREYPSPAKLAPDLA
jgi:hypothetical protein